MISNKWLFLRWANKYKPFWIVPLALALVFGLLTQHQAVAAVELIYFEAETLIGPAVLLEWETGSETDVAGYIIKRDAGAGPQTIEVYFDNELVTVIPAEGATVGAYYSVEDEEVDDLTTYTYYLYELSNSNVEAQVAVLTILVDEEGDEPTPFPIFTPTRIPGSGGQPTAAPSSTPIPTGTSAATTAPTSVPTTSSSGGATPTPRPTISSRGSTQPTPTTALQTVTTQNQPTATPFGFEETGSTSPTNESTSIGSNSEFENEGGEDQFSGGEVVINPIESFVESQNSAEAESSGPAAIAQAEAAVVQVDVSSMNGAQPIGQQALIEAGSDSAIVFDITADQSAQENDAATGRWILWASFLAALLLFIGGVAMSLRLFRRQ